MVRMAIGYDDRVAGCPITASSARLNAPAAKLGTAHPGELWMSQPGANGAWIQVDFGVSTTVGGIFLGNTNLTATGTIRSRLSANADMSAPSHDSGVVNAGCDPVYRKVFKTFAPAAGRYLQIELADPALTTLEAGVLRAWTVWLPGRGYSYGQKDRYKDFGTVKTGNNGSIWMMRGAKVRGVQFDLPAVTIAEWESWGDALSRLTGQTADILACLDLDAANRGRFCFFGPPEAVPEWQRVSFPHKSVAFTVFDRL